MAQAILDFHAAAEEARTAARREREPMERELAALKGRVQRTIDLMDRGVVSDADGEARLLEIKERRGELEALLAQLTPLPAVAAHPRAGDYYTALVGVLPETLEGDDAAGIREMVRSVIERVDFSPADSVGRFDLMVHGKFVRLLNYADDANEKPRQVGDLAGREVFGSFLGAGTGFEPVTFRL